MANKPTLIEVETLALKLDQAERWQLVHNLLKQLQAEGQAKKKQTRRRKGSKGDNVTVALPLSEAKDTQNGGDTPSSTATADETAPPRLGIAELVTPHRDEILRLAAQRKVNSIRVFGSVARGEARADSDVDFLVTFENDYTLLDQIGLWQDLSDLLGRPVDVTTEGGLKPRLRKIILEEVQPL